MRIALFFPGNIRESSGGALRVNLLLRYLVDHGHQVSVFSIGEDPDLLLDRTPHAGQPSVIYSRCPPPPFRQELKGPRFYRAFSRRLHPRYLQRKWVALRDALADRGHPRRAAERAALEMFVEFQLDPIFYREAGTLLDQAEVAIVEYPHWVALLAPLCRERGIKLLASAHDVLAISRQTTFGLNQLIGPREIEGFAQADQVFTVAEADQRYFLEHGVASICAVNPIDYEAIHGLAHQPPDPDLLKGAGISDQPICLFLGSNYGPNRDAATRIQVMAKALPQFQFVVAGGCRDPERAGNFLCLGRVPNDLLNALYQRADLILVPLESGTGSSIKTVESLAWGKALLGTSIGFRGYAIQHGVHALVEDNLEAYPAYILELMSQPVLRDHLGKNAAHLAQQYDYRVVFESYQRALGE